MLQKVGEFFTTINVNGTERVSKKQNSDETYNISEVFNSSISVNGTERESFNQSSDSTYDVSLSSTQKLSLQEDQASTSFTPHHDTYYHIVTLAFGDSDTGDQSIDYTIKDGNSNTVQTGTVYGEHLGYKVEYLSNQVPPLDVSFTSSFVDRTSTKIDCVSFEPEINIDRVDKY